AEIQTFAADVCVVSLPAPKVTLLKQLSYVNQATLYMTLLSAFAVLLQRYSGQDDIVVGSPIANRQEAQLEDLIGFFVNALVMRVHVNLDASFQELLAAVRGTTLEAYQHQDIPFERLVEELSPERSLNTTPLFQVMLALQNAPQGPQQLRGLEIAPIASDQLRVRFDLEVHAVEHDGSLQLYWLYNRDLFDRWRIEQVGEHYFRLLEAAVADADAPVRRLPMVSAVERQRVLEAFNATARALPECTVVDLFEAQAARTPEAEAVVFGDESLSYRELNARANRVAHELMARGVEPDTLVGVSMERSAEMIVALIGILKAGGAYVPIGGDLPLIRREQLVADARLRHMVASEANRSMFAERIEHVVTVAECAGLETNPGRKLAPSGLAYVNHTSGSTGVPKGVLVPHRA